MKEDIKSLRELLKAGKEGRGAPLDWRQLERVLNAAENALGLELALRNVSFMSRLALEEIDAGLYCGGKDQLLCIQDEINRALEVNT